MEVNSTGQDELTVLSLVSIYAIDAYGVCHPFEQEDCAEEPAMVVAVEEENAEKSTATTVISSQIDGSLKQNNSDLTRCEPGSSNSQLAVCLSTQPFSILDLHFYDSHPSLLFTNSASTPMLHPPSPFSGQVASPFKNCSISNNHAKKKKKKKWYHHHSYRLAALNQIRAYLTKKKTKKKKKKKKQRDRSEKVQMMQEMPVLVHQQQELESPSIDLSSLADIHLLPDLSKRKYIYKDVISSTINNQNQTNWRIFQCTQQSSPVPRLDPSVANDACYRPLYFIDDPLSLPDRRIGLSRRRSIKHLHKAVLD